MREPIYFAQNMVKHEIITTHFHQFHLFCVSCLFNFPKNWWESKWAVKSFKNFHFFGNQNVWRLWRWWYCDSGNYSLLFLTPDLLYIQLFQAGKFSVTLDFWYYFSDLKNFLDIKFFMQLPNFCTTFPTWKFFSNA